MWSYFPVVLYNKSETGVAGYAKDGELVINLTVQQNDDHFPKSLPSIVFFIRKK